MSSDTRHDAVAISYQILNALTDTINNARRTYGENASNRQEGQR